jgi:hypothetical protein
LASLSTFQQVSSFLSFILYNFVFQCISNLYMIAKNESN